MRNHDSAIGSAVITHNNSQHTVIKLFVTCILSINLCWLYYAVGSAVITHNNSQHTVIKLFVTCILSINLCWLYYLFCLFDR